ncbi:MFS transporter [Streptomyces sp. NPDC007088]|uniref:MFS transporter n=1 Tax=Streptomyces sp. NPDC007088 TaxID=3364773 RepID=UPI0036A4D8C7
MKVFPRTSSVLPSGVPSGLRLPRPGARAAVCAGFLAVWCAGAFLPLGGLLTGPWRERYGWSTGAVGAVLAVTMTLYGVTAPFAAALMERLGMRAVAAGALVLAGGGALLTGTVLTRLWQLVLFWGVFVGLGCGGLSMAFAATLSGRWSGRRRGLVAGVLTAASVLGQFGLLPVLSRLVSGPGWESALRVLGGAALSVAVLVLLLLREPPHRAAGSRGSRAPGALPVLLRAARTRVFWLLAGVFAVCGASTNGVMWTHFTPAAHDHGMPATTASSLLALVGFCNVVGTLGAGRLTDRFDARLLLGGVLAARGLVLCLLPLLLGPGADPQLLAFAAVFGALDVATVPPVIALCRSRFGAAGPVVFGWVNGAHQLGAALLAWAGGVAREVFGSYDPVWVAAGGLCAGAALLSLAVHTDHRSRTGHRGRTGRGGREGAAAVDDSAESNDFASRTP